MANPRAPLIPGVDYYMEAGKLVFTAEYHKKRGYCCNSKCRHCPYGNAPDQGKTIRIDGVTLPVLRGSGDKDR